MLAVLSPAKSLDYESPLPTRKYTQPRLLEDAQGLIDVMVTKSPEEVAALMHISAELAELNVQRYSDFSPPFTPATARPALFAFNGDVYQGMAARTRFDARDITEAQKTMRILSGLYGVLRPLDLMQPYRLEMGTKLRTDQGKNLYDWWGATIADTLKADLDAAPGAPVLVNLASEEYFSAVDPEVLGAPVVTPRFEDEDPRGRYRVVSFFAKRARGEMAAWLVQRRVRTVKALQCFDGAGYRFDPDRSTADTLVFRRPRSQTPAAKKATAAKSSSR